MLVRSRVLVVGAGYAGVMAANRLAGYRGTAGPIDVTLLNPVADFVERIRLHEVAAGNRETVAVPMSSLLHERVHLIEGTASRIDPAHRRVHLSDGRAPLEYDILLYAVGSAQTTGSIPASAFGLTNSEDADRLRAQLLQLNSGASVSIVGGGLTGIEIAAEIAETHPQLQVRLISRGSVAESISAPGRNAIIKRLSKIGVALLEHAGVEQVDESSITTSDGDVLRSDCTIWAVGFRAPDLARESSLPIDPAGRLMVDASLACSQHPEIFGAGDAVAAPQSVAGHLRMSCASALPLGAHAADSIIASLEAHAPAPLSAGYLVQCVSLGRMSGLAQMVRADDQPRRLAISGRLGAKIKEQICRMTLSWIREERRSSGSFTWPKGPRPVEGE